MSAIMAIGIVYLVMLFIQPNLLFNIGFQLSFAVTFAIMMSLPIFSKIPTKNAATFDCKYRMPISSVSHFTVSLL